MEKEIFGLLHIILTITASIYGLVTSKSWLDNIYIYYTLTVYLSWTFFNGECLISLYHKYKYNLKSHNARSDDMVVWFGNLKIHDNFMFIMSILTIFSIFRVFYRNNIYILYIILFICMLSVYMKLIKYYKNPCVSLYFLLFQSIFKIFLIYLIFYVYNLK
jgi:hypothetical protein